MINYKLLLSVLRFVQNCLWKSIAKRRQRNLLFCKEFNFDFLTWCSEILGIYKAPLVPSITLSLCECSRAHYQIPINRFVPFCSKYHSYLSGQFHSLSFRFNTRFFNSASFRFILSEFISSKNEIYDSFRFTPVCSVLLLSFQITFHYIYNSFSFRFISVAFHSVSLKLFVVAVVSD